MGISYAISLSFTTYPFTIFVHEGGLNVMRFSKHAIARHLVPSFTDNATNKWLCGVIFRLSAVSTTDTCKARLLVRYSFTLRSNFVCNSLVFCSHHHFHLPPQADPAQNCFHVPPQTVPVHHHFHLPPETDPIHHSYHIPPHADPVQHACIFHPRLTLSTTAFIFPTLGCPCLPYTVIGERWTHHAPDTVI